MLTLGRMFWDPGFRALISGLGLEVLLVLRLLGNGKITRWSSRKLERQQ